MLVPVVVRDARFRAGRTLVTTGRASEATGIFVRLLDGCRSTYKEDDIECAAAYYEYGNSLFRSLGEDNDDENPSSQEEASSETKMKSKASPQNEGDNQDLKRKAAAEAAEKRFSSLNQKPTQSNQSDHQKDDTNNNSNISENTMNDLPKDEIRDETTVEQKQASTEGGDDEDEQSDLELVLENMETAWSILDQHLSSPAPRYLEWGTEQFPRYLTGIGDVLSAMGRHADAADAYSRAVKHRQAQLQSLTEGSRNTTDDKEATAKRLIGQLICRRRIVETYVLMAEQFLACPPGEDVVTTETKSILCKANEREDFSRGYYDKAKDELQETVYLMGQIVATNPNFDIAEEKENICFASTLLMGVGMELEKASEKKNEIPDSQAKQPSKKKRKL